MVAKPGDILNPKGKPKGTPNKATKQAREAIAAFVDNNADRLAGWLDEIAADSPKDAFNCFMSVIEYHIPKLQRSEHDKDNAQHHIVEHTITEPDRELLKRIMKKIGKE